MRNYVWALGLLLWAAVSGCEDEGQAPTDLYVSFKTDLTLGSEVSAVRVRTFRATDNPATATALSEHTVSADTLTKKLPLVLEKREAGEILLAAQAVNASGEAQIERHVRARFQDGETISLQVFLGRSCLRKACPTPGDTCFGEAHGAACEGNCAAVEAAEDLPSWSQLRSDWTPAKCGPVTTTPDAGPPRMDGGIDAAVVDAGSCSATPAPGMACDPVSQCGCAPGKGCGLLAINGTAAQLGCTDPGTIANGGACTTDTCVAGSTCVGSQCRAFCGKDGDCGSNGHCVTAVTNDANAQPIVGLSACFAGCAIDSDCASGCCRPLPSAPGAGNLCLSAGACLVQAGGNCTTNAECFGFAQGSALCVTETSGGAICRATCTTGTDCQSGCCADLTGGGKACFAQSQCQSDCATANEPCQTNSDCCGGPGNTAVCVNQGQGPICADRCTANSQCESGCCAPLQASGSVCAPPLYCP